MKIKLEHKIINHCLIVYRKVDDKIDDLLKLSLDYDVQIEMVQEKKKEGETQKYAIRIHHQYKSGERTSWFFGGFDVETAKNNVNVLSIDLIEHWEKNRHFRDISSR